MVVALVVNTAWVLKQTSCPWAVTASELSITWQVLSNTKLFEMALRKQHVSAWRFCGA